MKFGWLTLALSPSPAEDAARIGFDDSLIFQEFKLPHAKKRVPFAQMMREEALAAFRAWEEKKDKIPY